jgi:D-sedoheptulose 7-phosphate isomerase
MKEQLLSSIKDCVSSVAQLSEPFALSFLEKAAILIAECFSSGGKLIIAGNGGSLCDASHFAQELTGLFRQFRPALSAIVLSEPGHITCVGNDLGFEWIFARGVESYGVQGDIFVGLTTSGNSPNIIKAIEISQSRGLKTIAFLGRGGGKLKGIADLELCIDGFANSDRIQEAHMAAIHIIIEMLEGLLFYDKAKQLGSLLS